MDSIADKLIKEKAIKIINSNIYKTSWQTPAKTLTGFKACEVKVSTTHHNY